MKFDWEKYLISVTDLAVKFSQNEECFKCKRRLFSLQPILYRGKALPYLP